MIIPCNSDDRKENQVKVQNGKSSNRLDFSKEVFKILSQAAGDTQIVESRLIAARQYVLDERHGFSSTPANGHEKENRSYESVLSKAKLLSLPKGLDINSSKGLILSEIDTKTPNSGRSTFQPASAQQIRWPRYYCSDGYLSPAASLTKKNWPKAKPSVVVADRPIPSFLNRFYFEVNVENTDGSSLTVEKLSGFFIGLWVGNSGLFADDEVSKNIPADVNNSKWYHPVNGRVVASGKVVKDLSFKGIEDIKINLACSNYVVVGCGWDI